MTHAYQELRQLGLSKLAIECYLCLYDNGPLLASQMAVNIGRPGMGMHRVLHRLVVYGFVESTKTKLGPTYFSGLPLTHALVSYHLYQRNLLKNLLIVQADGKR